MKLFKNGIINGGLHKMAEGKKESIWNGVKREHIVKAIQEFDVKDYVENHKKEMNCMKYYLWYAGKWYPSKHIRRMAYLEAYPGKAVPDFSGGKTDTKYFFEDARFGFEFRIYYIENMNPLKMQAENIPIDFEKIVDKIVIDNLIKENYACWPIEYHGEKGIEMCQYPRDPAMKKKALQMQHYRCMVDETHQTFIRKNNNLPYMESHHIVPMAMQQTQKYSLDVPENIAILCSSCHREIHYGKNAENMVTELFRKREDALKQRGIKITLEELLAWYKK